MRPKKRAWSTVVARLIGSAPLLLLFVGIACKSPQPTPFPTYTLYPTATPYPTYTPYPTQTPLRFPTRTPTPTWTPTPTATRSPREALTGYDINEIVSLASVWGEVAPGTPTDAILPWRLPLKMCIQEGAVRVGEWFSSYQLGNVPVDCKQFQTIRKLEQLPDPALLPGQGQLSLAAEPDWLATDLVACPLARSTLLSPKIGSIGSAASHGDAGWRQYGSIREGPTIQKGQQGRGFVSVAGYMGDFSGIFQTLLYLEEASTTEENWEKVVFHQELQLDLSHADSLGPCPVVLVPEEHRLILDPAFVHLLLTRGDESKRSQYLAEVIFHSAFHLLTNTSPYEPDPYIRP